MKPREMGPGEFRIACTCSMYAFPHHHVAFIDSRRWPGQTQDNMVQPMRPLLWGKARPFVVEGDDGRRYEVRQL